MRGSVVKRGNTWRYVVDVGRWIGLILETWARRCDEA